MINMGQNRGSNYDSDKNKKNLGNDPRFIKFGAELVLQRSMSLISNEYDTFQSLTLILALGRQVAGPYRSVGGTKKN